MNITNVFTLNDIVLTLRTYERWSLALMVSAFSGNQRARYNKPNLYIDDKQLISFRLKNFYFSSKGLVGVFTVVMQRPSTLKMLYVVWNGKEFKGFLRED